MSDLSGALAGLADLPIWVGWNDENGRKVPKSANGGNARTNDPSTWGTYSRVSAIVTANNYSGIGVVLTDGLVGIDLDGVIDSRGSIASWAQDIIDSIASYTEISPSGTGVHILVYGDADVLGAIGRANHSQGIEIYNHGRYFTVTGNQIGSSGLNDRTQAVNDLLRRYFPNESNEERLRKSVRSLAEDQARRRANDAMIANAARDGLRYARIPVGDACGFCVLLGSRGFVYHSEAKAGGLGSKYHTHCRCKIMAGFGDMGIEGYDPDELSEIYEQARLQTGKANPTAAEVSRQIELILAGQGGYPGNTSSMNNAAGTSLSDFDNRVLHAAQADQGIDLEKVIAAMESFSISASKLENYSLSYAGDENKARAFEEYLGYTDSDAATVAALVYEHVADHSPEYRDTIEYGDRYTTAMTMRGKEDQTARVKVGWIEEDGVAKMRLTSIYVNQ